MKTMRYRDCYGFSSATAHCRQAGFSLLEMIAALTILSIGSVVLFSWLGQTTGQLSRFQLQEKASMARIQAVDFLSVQNPAINPSGKQAFDGFSIEWTGEPVAETRESVSPTGGLGLYQISLFQLNVTVYDKQGQRWFVFPLKLAGYKQVRKPANDKPF